ncbi:phage tail sheath family protein [Bradyrhizobium diazoefficiens]|uniref:phage tail sheath family protein n=1 Tax=Bradyrhizobium diazoefficiens TaxID=1355477 RepID=UPI0004BCA439|nr:phage tail sheath family protein [Bradyrhizobium diazoefficiens]
MPEYLTPGVYIEEIERGPRPIEGVPTSTAAFLGETERGPISPRMVTSYIEYKRWFGDVFRPQRDRYMPYAASGFFENGGKRLYVCRIVGDDATTASAVLHDNFRVSAVGAGAWGKRIFAKIGKGTTEAVPPGGTEKKSIGLRLQVAYWASYPEGAPLFDPFVASDPVKMPRPTLTEDWDDLSLDPKSPDYYEKRLTGNSALVELIRIDETNGTLPEDDQSATLENGEDAPEIDVADYVGEPAGNRQTAQGLFALTMDPYRDVALVHAPFFAPAQDLVTKKVVSHCENMRFRFAVIDSDLTTSNYNDVDPRTKVVESQYAAFYYPWLQVADPQSGALKYVPPGGYALGVYARTDVERGVFKAPANETVRGAVGLRFDINDRMQETLNPRGVNVIRAFPGRGIRIWGARTLSSNGLWKYVSVRRLFIFLERSIYEGTQWVVFEPNDDRLWARVTDTVRLFLRTQWRNGALFGRVEKEAFFITCDRTTMTQDDILNGRLICEIGIAPVRPAEFVVFRIFQHTAEAQR